MCDYIVYILNLYVCLSYLTTENVLFFNLALCISALCFLMNDDCLLLFMVTWVSAGLYCMRACTQLHLRAILIWVKQSSQWDADVSTNTPQQHVGLSKHTVTGVDWDQLTKLDRADLLTNRRAATYTTVYKPDMVVCEDVTVIWKIRMYV